MSIFVPHAQPKPSDKTAYVFNFNALQGGPLPLGQFRGKAVLLVNTASECGFTPQYNGLEALYGKYKDKGLVVLGVPANDFGGQEPGTAEQIGAFCEKNYGVTFPMAAKEVVSGSGAHPFYKWVHEVLGFNSAPKWNFHKFLIGRDGRPIDYFASNVAPDSDKLIADVEKALGA